MDRICKVQEISGRKSCLHCNGAGSVVVKSDSGKKEMVPCPVCGGGGKDVLVVK